MTMSSQILNMSKDGDSAVSLDSLFQDSASPRTEDFNSTVEDTVKRSLKVNQLNSYKVSSDSPSDL